YLQDIEKSYLNLTGLSLPEEILQWPGVRIYADVIQSEPFRDCHSGHIWGDTRYTPKDPFHCDNRPRLIFTLALALVEDRHVNLNRVTTPVDLEQRTVDALWHLLDICKLFVQLREDRALSKATQLQTTHVHTRALWEAFNLVRRVVSALGPAEYTLSH